MRAYVVKYAGLCNRPSRTISGEIVVEASSLHVAAARAVKDIVKHERLSRASAIEILNMRFAKGGSITRSAAAADKATVLS